MSARSFRSFAVVLVALSLIGQLSWLGNTAYPLWALVIISLDVIIIYALARYGVAAFE